MRLASAGTLSDKNPNLTVQSPASPNWTGFYLGAFAGYKYSAVDHDLRLGGTFNQIPFGKSGLESRGSGDLDNDGTERGGLLGFNYQFRQLIFGVEAAGGYLWTRKSNNTGSFILGEGVPPLEIRNSIKTHYLVTVAQRIGFALGHFLPDVTSGMGIGDLDFSQSVHDLADPNDSHCRRKDADECRLDGWWRIAMRLHPILECKSNINTLIYIDLGQGDFDARVTNTPNFHSHHDASLTEHNASFALIYQL